MLRVTINGVECEVAEGSTILQALRAREIHVPTLCHDDRIKPIGGCRLCVVELQDRGRMVASCTTPVESGMQIVTHSESVENHRRTNLRLLAQSVPPRDPKLPETEFDRYLAAYGLTCSGATGDGFKDFAHPYLSVDMDRCVTCYRCIRICEELQGQFVWRAWNRGDRTEIRPDKGTTMLDSSCVSCGACADTCPTGAISDRLVRDLGTPLEWTRTTCPYCGTGCEMEVGTRDGQVVVARPLNESPVAKGHLCVKGRYAHRFAHANDRMTEPMIRENGEWRVVTWDEAYEFAANRLSEILAESGPQSVGVLGSARATNEENYVAQKFARVVLGSNNVDCCARVCHAPSAAALKATLGTGAATNSFNDIEVAEGFLVCGANPTENHPIVGARIKQAVLKGAKLVVIDPRRIELAEYADVYLQVRAGTNIPLLHSLAKVIIEEGLIDREFIEQRTADFERFRELVAEWTPEFAATVCGVSADDIRAAARLYATTRPSMIFHGLGMTEHTQGTEGVRCLVNLALLTGNLGKPGSGENPLRGQNNVQGSAHMGCEPSNLAGYTPIAQIGDEVEQIWGAPVPRQQGLTWMQMLDAAGRGELRALWAIGYDVYFSNANANVSANALKNIELLIVQDLFLTETAREFANVFFPACSSYEKDGTFMNSERRVQRIRQAIPVVGNSKPDWQIIDELATRMGKGEFFAFSDPEAIWDEVRKVWKAGSGISYARIEHAGLQWPCKSEDDPGTTILHQKSFPIGERAAFSLMEYRPTIERVSEEFPMLLTTGRALEHFNAGTMSRRTGNTVLMPTDYLTISHEDASRFEVRDGDEVQLVSRYGRARLPVKVSGKMRPGELFTTFHDPNVFTNRVTSNERDTVVGAPEYKVTAVRIEV